jgi:hypothetical protein
MKQNSSQERKKAGREWLAIIGIFVLAFAAANPKLVRRG